VFEYLGNTVGVQSLKGIGYGLTGGRDFIWVILPIVSEFPATQPDVTVNWGTDVALANTVEYAKQAVREVCDNWGGDPANCVLVGNSRGGIACNLIGLYDDEIASLWRAMVPSAHYLSDGVDFTGTKVALGGADYRAVAATSIARLGTIAQLIVAEYNTDILSGKPDAELIPKITAAGYSTLGEAITALKLKPVYDSSLTKTRAFVESHKPPTSTVVFYPLAWVNHGSLYSLRHTPERAFIRTWLRQQVGLPASDENGR
jgi:acetyl esterase/lipase